MKIATSPERHAEHVQTTGSPIRRFARGFWNLVRAHPFEALLTLLTTFYVAFALSPSSYGFALRIFEVADQRTYLGSPRLQRWDEWAVATPYIQALVRTGFALRNTTSFYGESFRNLLALPLRDWALAFRPLSWGYLFLPPAWGFSLYWGAAAWLTLVGWSVLLRKVGTTYILSIAGSLAIFFAPFTQSWWTGIAPLCALFPWLMIAFTSGRRLRVVLPATAWLAGCLVISTAYLPGLVYMAFVGAIFLAAFVFHRDRMGRTILVGVAALAGGVVGILYLAPVLERLADTAYPARRTVPGGSLPLAQWFSQFTPFGVTRGFSSLISFNVPESVAMGSWLPLAALSLIDYKRLLSETAEGLFRPALWLWTGFILCSGWQLLSSLHWLGALFGWNRAVEQRSLIASGSLLIVLSVWVLSQFPIRLDTKRLAVLAVVLLGGVFVTALMLDGPGFNWTGLLSNTRDNLLALLGTIFVAAFLVGAKIKPAQERLRVGKVAMILVVPLAAVWSLYNPVQDARPIFQPIDTDMTRRLDEAAAVRPDGAMAANFPGAVLNGLGYRSVVHALPLPEVGTFARMFPDLDRARLNHIFNRYAELYVYHGEEVLLREPGMIYLPSSVVRQFATFTPVSAYPLR